MPLYEGRANTENKIKVKKEWADCELGMFYHFDIPIYKPGWNWCTFKNFPDPKIFNPEKLNTDQWLESAKLLGAKYAVLVAKHCSGFLTWQSDLYPYGVKQATWRNGKGDIVRDFIKSCEKYEIRSGIYASVSANAYWEVDKGLVNQGKGGNNKKQKSYAQMCEQMLTELWSKYGKLFEIWFDGGALPKDEGGPDLIPLVEKYQSKALIFQGPAANIRWIGNERGVASYPNWATIKNMDDRSGDPNGEIWMPGECDVPIRNHEWFWKKGDEHKVYSLDELMNMYYNSVGRNSNLLLNANPNTDGLVPEIDMKRYNEFGNEIRKRFSKPLAKTNGKGNTITLKLLKETKIDHIVIMEDIKYGERIRKYKVEGHTQDGWKNLCSGISVGHKRIQKINPVTVQSVRLNILNSTAKPVIREFAAFYCKV